MKPVRQLWNPPVFEVSGEIKKLNDRNRSWLVRNRDPSVPFSVSDDAFTVEYLFDLRRVEAISRLQKCEALQAGRDKPTKAGVHASNETQEHGGWGADGQTVKPRRVAVTERGTR